MSAPEPVGLYPHARRVGNLLFLSGVGPRKKGSKEIPGVTLDAKGKVVSTSRVDRSILQSFFDHTANGATFSKYGYRQ